jgi:hypothetical protein
LRRLLLALLVMVPASTTAVSAWGFVAHRIMAENSAASLPAPMAGFYQANMSALSDASIEPDSLLRDKEGEKEARRHFIDLDELSQPPFLDFPMDEQRARELYGDKRVDHAGILPWRIVNVLDQLREAFRKKDLSGIVSRSGWLSHYVGDACQPLHTTRNFDGQLSCNHGIHAAFETDMIDRLKARYRLETAMPSSFVPEVIHEPRRFIFAELFASFNLVPDLLRADTDSVAAVKKQRKDYYEELERRAGTLARARMSRAETATANLWYTAWFQAGRPELPAAPLPRSPRVPRATRP